MITVLLITLAVLLIALWRSEYGLGAIILLWPAYLLRTTIVDIPTTALELSLYALLIACLIKAGHKKELAWPKLSGWQWSLLALWIVAWALATMFSQDRQASLGAFKAWLVDPIIFGFILWSVTRQIKNKITIISSVMLSGAIVALAGLGQMIWWRDTLQDGRLSSFFHPVANYAAMFLGPILIITIGAVLYKLVNRWWWAAAAVMALALILTVSFGGYLATAAAALILWWHWPNKKRKIITLVVGAVMALIGVGLLTQTKYFGEHFNNTDRSSALVRQQIWGSSVQIIKEHPWFGIGPNAFEASYREMVARLYWPPLEWLVSQPHNLYLALWLETGLLGVLVFISFIIAWIKWLWPRIKKHEAITVISFAAMTTILVHGLVDTPVFKNDLALLFVLVVLWPWFSPEHQSEPAKK